MSQSDIAQPLDVSGPTLEEAIEKGLTELGLSRNDVIIEIIEEGNKGMLGFGAREAVVRLTPLRSPQPAKPPISAGSGFVSAPVTEEELEEEASIAKEALQELLAKMEVDDASIKTRRAEAGSLDEAPPWILDVVEGDELGTLIGRRGETLEALQYITRLIVSRKLQRRSTIVIDVEDYKQRRESTLKKLAVRMAAQAKQLGRIMTLEPMPPNERRIIHLTLREDQDVSTESVGEGDRRKVTIIPERSARR
ncbi:MAG: protein jag [Anaerolineae bacterium]|nr:protein jag [Anaerolineae bacterium]